MDRHIFTNLMTLSNRGTLYRCLQIFLVPKTKPKVITTVISKTKPKAITVATVIPTGYGGHTHAV